MTLLIAGLILLGQEKHTPKPLPPNAKSAVTVGEVNQVMSKVEAATRRILKLGGATAKPATGAKAATRAEVINAYYSVYELARPKFRIAPNPIAYDVKVFSVSGESLKKLEVLVRQGFVGKVGPLATSKQSGLSLQEFGDSLGLFVARLADLTHTPSRQWSPYLWDR